MIEVAEWIMVACPRSATKGEEELVYDRAVPGGGSIATADEVAVGPDPSASDAVVISLRPGTTATPLFFYRPVEHPTWARTEELRFSLSADATSFDDRQLPDLADVVDRDVSRCAAYGAPPAASASASAAPSAAPSDGPLDAGPPPGDPELPDVEGMPPVPSDEAWAAEKEALVTGSDALGCKTKVKDSWFSARCSGKVVFRGVAVEVGKHKTQTHAEIVDGELRVLTPFVEDTDFRARITLADGAQRLSLVWRKGKRPLEIGRFTDAR